MTTPSCIVAWKIPWMEEPGRLQSRGLLRVAQSCPTLSDPMDCSPPGSSVLARVLEWGAIAFSIFSF